MPLLALAATVMLESGERASLSQAAEGIQSQFNVSDFWILVMVVPLPRWRRPRWEAGLGTLTVTLPDVPSACVLGLEIS